MAWAAVAGRGRERWQAAAGREELELAGRLGAGEPGGGEDAGGEKEKEATGGEGKRKKKEREREKREQGPRKNRKRTCL